MTTVEEIMNAPTECLKCGKVAPEEITTTEKTYPDSGIPASLVETHKCTACGHTYKRTIKINSLGRVF